ncbi:MAG: nucleotidyl transferase AbiEii/AbiGii toxin family protein [bacterium]|nr:nucleotidyl transferase AbiEii/AbiGii toxin family protein [bacterium]
MTNLYSPLEIVAEGFQELLPEMVFVGGASVILHMNSTSAQIPRPTEDVDCVVEITSRLMFEELQSNLRAKGFLHDFRQGAPICRWIYQNVTVDVMPTNSELLGFTNSWYEDGVRNKARHILPNGREIYTFSLPYFLATKLEAFSSRGDADLRFDSDLEDILLVLDGNKDPVSVINEAGTNVREFLRGSFADLLESSLFHELIEGTVAQEGKSRVTRLKEIIKNISL